MREITWTNNLLIMAGTKSDEAREFYLRLAIKENYTKRELERQLQSAYYERYMLSEKNILPIKREVLNDNNYLNTRIIDTYSLEFLDLPNNFYENDLKKLNKNKFYVKLCE